MAGHELTLSTLAHATQETVKPYFKRSIKVSIDPALRGNHTYDLAFVYACNLLARMFPNTCSDYFPDLGVAKLLTRPKDLSTSSHFAVELVFGTFPEVKADCRLYASCSNWMVFCQKTPARVDPLEPWNPVLAIITACYAAARVSVAIFGDLVSAVDELCPFSILDFRDGAVGYDWSTPLDVGIVHVVGIGAVGTAFLFALAAHGVLRGTFHLIDEDCVEEANLESYSIFTSNELGKRKTCSAVRLLTTLQMPFHLESQPHKLQDYVEKASHQDPKFRISRLISAPDRRDTRRKFQGLLPRELWDASTGPNDVVIHHNRFNPRLACLACIYPEVPDEDAHLRHIAETLNLPIERVRVGQDISESDAEKIRARYPHLAGRSLIGRPYNTVFKELCSAGQLKVEDEVVLAPFPFISGLAGALLYFDFLQTLSPQIFGRFQNYNYMRLDPLQQPNPQLRIQRPAREGCPVCKNSTIRRYFDRLWNSDI